MCGRASSQYASLAFGCDPRLHAASLGATPAECPGEAWAQGVALGAAGRYGAALRVLEPLTRGAAARADPLHASLAACAVASHRRQLGAHRASYRLDALALRLSGGVPPQAAREARADALLGLAADAIGLGRAARCEQLLRYVYDAGLIGDWRTRIRYGWIRTEWLLGTGCFATALECARATQAYAERGPSGRHVTKSAMQSAVCLVAQETECGRAEGVELAREVLAAALDRGLMSLVWPTALLLRDAGVSDGAALTDLARNVLTSILDQVDGAGRRLALESPWMPPELLRKGDRGAT